MPARDQRGQQHRGLVRAPHPAGLRCAEALLRPAVRALWGPACSAAGRPAHAAAPCGTVPPPRRYQSTISGSFQVVEIIETFVSYMESLDRCVCIVYDTTAAAGGALGLKAIRLAEPFVEAYREGARLLRCRCRCWDGGEGGRLGDAARWQAPDAPRPRNQPLARRLADDREDPCQGAVLARRVCRDPGQPAQ